MIVRFNIDPAGLNEAMAQGRFDYQVSFEGEALYADSGLESIEDCITAATEGLGSDAVAAEVAYKNIISGTYALGSLALATAQIALHALQTTQAVEEVMTGRNS